MHIQLKRGLILLLKESKTIYFDLIYSDAKLLISNI